jgi:HK97 family phage major capsid protein
MSRLRTLRQEKQALKQSLESLVAARDADEREFSAEETDKIGRITERAAKIEADLTFEEELYANLRQLEGKPDANSEADERARAEAAKTKEKPKFSSLGEQLQAVAQAARAGAQVDQRLRYDAAASGLNETTPSDGGFMVQIDFASGLLQRTYELGQVMSRVRRVGISSNSNGLKLNAIDETSRADGSRFGGLLTYWRDEADTVTAKKPKFRQMELNLKSLMGLCYATEEVLQDANALESVISQAFPEELRFKVEDAILSGTGAGQPLGIFNSGALVTVSKEGGQAAASVTYNNLIDMWARLWPSSQSNSVWLHNVDVTPALMKMTMPAGAGAVPVYLPPGGASGAPYGTLFGRPCIATEYSSTLGTVGDLALVDLSQYLMIDKGGIQSASSMHVRFLYDEMTYRFTYRVDGQPIWNSALTPKNGSNTLSPFVVLATRS